MISVFVFYEENYRLTSSYTAHLHVWDGWEQRVG